MEWYLIISLFLGSLIILIFTGLPVSFSFFLVSCTTMFLLFGEAGIRQLILGMQNQLNNFTFTAIPFFVLMGEIFFHSGIITKSMDAVSKLVRNLPGRLCSVTLITGAIFAALTGSGIANIAMFGSLMLPEMRKRGYDTGLTATSIMASGTLAIIIPPSTLLLILAGISGISAANLLLGAIVPGLIMAALFLGYIIVRCIINPDLAPQSQDDAEVVGIPFSERIKEFCLHVVPLMIIILVIILTIFTGFGTTTEAAAAGAFAAYILTFFYRKFSFDLLKKTLIGSIRSSVMLLFIIAASVGYSQVLSLTGASRSMVMAVTSIIGSEIALLIIMILITFFVGTFMNESSTMMVTLPLFMPIIREFGINDVWFGVLMMVTIMVGQFSPPVGMGCFAMKGVSPPDVTLGTIFKAAVPIILVITLVIALLLLFPALATTIPGV